MLIGLGTGSFDATVKFWDTKSNSTKPLLTLSEAKDSVSSLAVAGHHIFAGSIDGRVRKYDIRMGEVYVDLIGSPVTSVTTTNQADSVLVSTLDSTLRLMDQKDGKCLKIYKADGFVNETYRIRSTLGCGEAFVLSGSENGEIFVWDLLEGNVRYQLRHDPASKHKPTTGKQEVISAVTYCPTRMEWASAGGDGIFPLMIVWQCILTEKQAKWFFGPQTNIFSFSPSDLKLVHKRLCKPKMRLDIKRVTVLLADRSI